MTSAENRLVVSTACPTCGAPLDFGEGSNCVACGYCRSSSLVTGRGRLLSYAITPKVEGRDAFAIARFAEPSSGAPLRIGEPRLFFFPYYRFRAIELRWQRADPGPKPVEFAPETQQEYPPAISIARVLAELAPKPDEVELRERHVERNFLALEGMPSELYSLGLRPTTLRLSLFGRETLEALGTVVAPQIAKEQATLRGERSIDEHRVAHRELVARMLSLVYFPFWLVPVERPGRRALSIVDAVSRAVVLRDAPGDLAERLHAPSSDAKTVGFRPLVCPNCGWSLELRPDDFIFYCSTCSRAWRIDGQELVAIERRFAAGGDKHLPFWELLGRLDEEAPRRWFAPAFRCRRMKVLADLSKRVSPAEIVETPEPPKNVHGVFFDESDARAIAEFSQAGEAGDRFEDVEERELAVESAGLLWLPFRAEPYSYREPTSGIAFAKNLLL